MQTIPDPARFFAANGTFLGQLYALAVMRTLSASERRSVLNVLEQHSA